MTKKKNHCTWREQKRERKKEKNGKKVEQTEMYNRKKLSDIIVNFKQWRNYRFHWEVGHSILKPRGNRLTEHFS